MRRTLWLVVIALLALEAPSLAQQRDAPRDRLGLRPGCDLQWEAPSPAATLPARFPWANGRASEPRPALPRTPRMQVGRTYESRYGFRIEVISEREWKPGIYFYDVEFVASPGYPQVGDRLCLGFHDYNSTIWRLVP